MSCGDGWTAWCLARDGVVERFYEIEEDNHIGGPHPAEAGYVLPDEDDGLPDNAYADIDLSDPQAFKARRAQLKEQYGVPDTCHATGIAARTSIDPTALGPHTRLGGRAILAITACGRDHGIAPGSLSI
jgi:hypothetical protein